MEQDFWKDLMPEMVSPEMAEVERKKAELSLKNVEKQLAFLYMWVILRVG